MKSRTKVYVEKEFAGWLTLEELEVLRKEAHRLATEKQAVEQADHMVYGYYNYDEEDIVGSQIG